MALIWFLFDRLVQDFCLSVFEYEDGLLFNKDLPVSDMTVLIPGPVVIGNDSTLIVLNDLGLLCTGEGGFFGLAKGGGNDVLWVLFWYITTDSLSVSSSV